MDAAEHGVFFCPLGGGGRLKFGLAGVVVILPILFWAGCGGGSSSTPTPPAGLQVTNGNPPSGTVGSLYNGSASGFAFTASGGKPPYSWALASGTVPHNLSLSASGDTELLSGTPDSASTYNFALQVTDSAGTGVTSPSYSVTISSSTALQPYQVGSVVTATSTQPEAEQAIAIDPNSDSSLVAAIIDFSLQGGGFGALKYAVSTNKGASWTESFVPLSGLMASNADGSWADNRDPSLAIDKSGNVFLTGIYAQAPQSGVQPPTGVYTCASTLPAVNLTANACRPVFTNLASDNRFMEDKAAVAVDNSNSSFSGRVYVAWIHFTGCTGGKCTSKFIDVSHSSDHGVTWSAPLSLTTGSSAVTWPQLVVGSDGTVYVAYGVAMSGGMDQHMLNLSTDGGQTFAAAQAMTPVFTDISFSTAYRKNSGPNIALSSVAGSEYVYDVYAQQNGSGSDIVVARSNQPKGAGGFTTPLAVNDSTAGQRMFPAAAVDGNGLLHMFWFDTRNAGGTDMYDVYAAYSKNLAATIAPNARVTPSLITAGTASGVFIGDYTGIAAEATSGVAHAVWTSGGSNGGMLQTTTLTAP
jgi:hypothetical protein